MKPSITLTFLPGSGWCATAVKDEESFVCSEPYKDPHDALRWVLQVIAEDWFCGLS